jgi:hypothetical protein
MASSMAVTTTPDLLTEFSRTCVPSLSLAALSKSLAAEGWKSVPNSDGRIAGVIAAVGPMLDAQGLSSDYTTYALDREGRHFELAVSETKKPVADGHKLIGCSVYDFAAVSPVDPKAVEALAKGVTGEQSSLGDVRVEKWNNIHGAGSGMRAVFVPPNSQIKSQLGFTGMMLGTHFLDGATN